MVCCSNMQAPGGSSALLCLPEHSPLDRQIVGISPTVFPKIREGRQTRQGTAARDRKVGEQNRSVRIVLGGMKRDSVSNCSQEPVRILFPRAASM
jgi:hypothetical protein